MDKKSCKNRKYIKHGILEAVIAPSDQIEVDFLSEKLFNLKLQLSEKLAMYEQLEREIQIVEQEVERISIKLENAIKYMKDEHIDRLVY